MEILVVTWNYPPHRGGIENLVGNLCRELGRKHSLRILTGHAPSAAKEKNVDRSPLPGLVPFAFYALWRGSCLLARNPRISVIFGGSVVVAPLVLLLACVFDRRAILQAHGLDVIYHSFLYQQLCVRWLKTSDQVIANSRYTAQLVQSKGVSPERIAVISPGIETDRFHAPSGLAVVKGAREVKNQKTILFVGRLARRKGVKEFIENSLARIVDAVPQVLFLIAGANPIESLKHRDDVVSEITHVVLKLRLDEHVRLLGPISDDELIDRYQACDLVVLPVLDTKDDVEGFGIVALEAAAAGKPVIATRAGGIPDAVEHGKSGVLVEPGDYSQLSQTIIALLQDREACLSLGQYGRSRAVNEFSWRRISARYEDMFDSVTRRVI